MKHTVLLLFVFTLFGCGGDSKSSNTKPIEKAPVITAHANSFEIKKGNTIKGSVSGSHSNNETLSYTLVSAPNTGHFVFNTNGVFSFSLERNEVQNHSQFSFTAHANGSESAPAVVSINYLSADNTAPIAQPQNVSVNLDSVITGALNGIDAEDDPVSYTLISDVSVGKLTFDHEKGRFIYLSPEQYSSPQTSFIYQMSDGITNSEPVKITINIIDKAPTINEYSYQLFGSVNEELTGLFFKYDEQASSNLDEQAQIISVPKYGAFTANQSSFFYQANADKLNQARVSTDRVIVLITDNEGQYHVARYEFILADHNLNQLPKSIEPLEPQWQSADDFPEMLNDVLSGSDPFSSDFIDSDELFIAGIKALDTLALHSHIHDKHLARLSYYIRAHIYNIGAENFTPAQRLMLDTVSWRITTMVGFYGLSEAAAKLHQSYTDLSYILVYYADDIEAVSKYYDISLTLFDLYSRYHGDDLSYYQRSGIYNIWDYLDRISYAFKFHNDQSFANKYYNSSLLSSLKKLATSSITPAGDDYFMLYNIFNLGYELWLDDNTQWQDNLEKTMVEITAFHVNQVSHEQALIIKSKFYSHFLSQAVGYYSPDTAQQLCKNDYADVCYIITEKEVLPNAETCMSNVELRYHNLNHGQLNQLCQSLTATAERFHQLLLTNYQPVNDDFNDTLVASIFNSSSDYTNYGWALYGISTNNGGIYMEGNPSVIDNQAHLYVYQQGTDEQWWVWNWQHEFSHYLDGRFVQYGDFGYLPLNTTTWWTEGLAEYIAWADDFPRGMHNITAVETANRPTIDEIISIDYSASSALIYSWSYALHRFLVEQQPDIHQTLKECLRMGDIDCYRNQTSRLNEHQSAFESWTSVLVNNWQTKQITSKNKSYYSEQQLKLDEKYLLKHSKFHSTNHHKSSSFNKKLLKQKETTF